MTRPARHSWPPIAVLAVLAALPLMAAGDDTKPARPDVAVVTSFPEQAPQSEMAQVAGGSLFKSYCASCHGTNARGDGPLADQLRVRPPDLTLFASRNEGKFDKDKVRRIIDGRQPVKGHGGSDMPVWGDAFKQAEDGFSEKTVQQRIHALVDYLASVQSTK